MNKKIQTNSKTTNKQSGFSMIELLVAMVITLFMTGVAMTYFVSSARAYKTQVADGRIQENIRFGLDMLSNNLRFAGFCDSANISLCRGLMKIYTGSTCEPGRTPGVGINLCNNDVDQVTDRLAIDFASRTATTACAGAVAVPAETHIYMTFWIDNVTRSLNCQAFSLIDNVAAEIDNVVQLVDGIDAMQIQYGIDTNSDSFVDSYQSISDVPASASIETVKLVMLANSGLTADRDKDLEDAQTRTYTLFDETITFGAADPRSRELKQIFSTTVHLKSK